ncbi:MAG: Polyphosphate:AMP phosphotransferase [Bacteroidetes bacterium]|jgi:PPK2 family polyphosphate:nucleotide phosphotransferase|nr:Polyphosphate:AMP phosphotransferase [Bacteroidota bacterium]
MNIDKYRVESGKKVSLKDYDTRDTGSYKDKTDAAGDLQKDVEHLAELQDVLYAQNSRSLLLIFQAMDAAGKDSVIKHVMSGINPQGCQVFSFKSPSAEELDHDFLWRCLKALPERGRIGIFNRSYYEEVLVVRVHPEFLKGQRLPEKTMEDSIWKHRYEDINAVERYLERNGVTILKFFLHVSKKEQKERFLERIEMPEKNWKFSVADVKERGFWKDYMDAYEEMLEKTSTAWAPWYVIPADRKWYTRALVAEIINSALESMNLSYPVLSKAQKADLASARELLLAEE